MAHNSDNTNKFTPEDRNVYTESEALDQQGLVYLRGTSISDQTQCTDFKEVLIFQESVSCIWCNFRTRHDFNYWDQTIYFESRWKAMWNGHTVVRNIFLCQIKEHSGLNYYRNQGVTAHIHSINQIRFPLLKQWPKIKDFTELVLISKSTSMPRWSLLHVLLSIFFNPD